MAKKTEVATVSNETAITRPSFIPASSEGTGHITKEDVTIPRLAICQQMSPQLVEGDPKYIPGLTQGEMFNTLTGDSLGKGPITFHVVRADKPRWIEFIPRDEGGGIKDFNVPAGDPRTQWGSNGEPPLATKFYDFLIVPLPIPEDVSGLNLVLALSMKSSQIKVAKQFNMMIKARGSALYAGRYTLSTFLDKNQLGQFYNFRVGLAGWADTEQQYAMFSQLFADLKDRDVAIDREPGSDDDDEGEPAPKM